eukprot:GHVN01077846.1.p1 GENE.GHVN01077846.1~~GHVN01077846.1.p1  ORF type:complete len:573 (+),score=103.05 GHVN01077846.1:293-2011(+)
MESAIIGEGGAPIREEQVKNAIHFLTHSSVQSAPDSQKGQFLVQKGLTNDEIRAAFEMVARGGGGSVVSAGEAHSHQINDSTFRLGNSVPSYRPQHPTTYGPSQERPSPTFLAGGHLAGSPQSLHTNERSWAWKLFKNMIVPVLVSAGIIFVGSALKNRFQFTDNTKATPKTSSPKERERAGRPERNRRERERRSQRQSKQSDNVNNYGIGVPDTGADADKLSESSSTSRYDRSQISKLSLEIENLKSEIQIRDVQLAESLAARIRDLTESNNQALEVAVRRLEDLFFSENHIANTGATNAVEPLTLTSLISQSPVGSVSSITPSPSANHEPTSSVDGSDSKKASRNKLRRDDPSTPSFGDGHGDIKINRSSPSHSSRPPDSPQKPHAVDSPTAESVRDGIAKVMKACSIDGIDPARSLGALTLITRNLLANPTVKVYRKLNTSSPRFSDLFGIHSDRATPKELRGVLEMIGFQLKGNTYIYDPDDLTPIQIASEGIKDAMTSLTDDQSVTPPIHSVSQAVNSTSAIQLTGESNSQRGGAVSQSKDDQFLRGGPGTEIPGDHNNRGVGNVLI